MNWRRGLFRLWIVGSALFVIAVAFVSYSQIKEQAGEVETIATDAGLADWVHQRFYSDMPREQFDKKIAARKMKDHRPCRSRSNFVAASSSMPQRAIVG
jgi:hypothetical protein